MLSSSITILYDHYKDTFKIIENTIALREKNFKWAIILVVVSLLLTLYPTAGFELSRGIGVEKVKINLSGHLFYTINSFLLFTAIWFWNKYFRNVLQIENLYLYIRRLEDKLTTDGKVEITREGKFYLKHYPVVKSVINNFYKIFIPIILIPTVFVKGLNEWFLETGGEPLPIRIIDSAAIFFLIVITILYLYGYIFKILKRRNNS